MISTLHGVPARSFFPNTISRSHRAAPPLALQEADPSKADYFWMAGPNLSPKSKLKHVRMRWPYWNDTVAKSLGARHILTTLGERGIGDSDLRPSLPSSSHAFKLLQQLVDPVSDAEMHPASRKRAWLVLSLNGMSDFKSERQRRYNNSGYYEDCHLCHVCFRAGVDIVIPPPAATIDVPPCNELETITSEAAAAGSVTTRDTLFFWAGRVVPGAHHANPMYEKAPNPRELLMAVQGEPGFKIVNTFPDRHNNNASSRPGRRLQNGEVQPAGYVNKVEWMRRSVFCWAPAGAALWRCKAAHTIRLSRLHSCADAGGRPPYARGDLAVE